MAEPSPQLRCPRCGALIPASAVVKQLVGAQPAPGPHPDRAPATGRHPTAAELAALRARLAAVAAAASSVEEQVAEFFEAAARRKPERAGELQAVAAAASEQAARERRWAQDYGAAQVGWPSNTDE